MDAKNQKPRIPSVELRKAGTLLLRLSIIALVLSIVGTLFEWFHWTFIVAAVFGIFVANISETILNAFADMSEKIDRLADDNKRESGE